MQKKINQRTLNKKKTIIIDVDEFNQIDFWFTNEKISKTFLIIFENENFMNYKSYSKQFANDSKNEKFKKNDFDSFVFFLFEINFEVSIIVNFFFSIFFFLILTKIFFFYFRFSVLWLSFHRKRRFQRFCLFNKDWIKYFTRLKNRSSVWKLNSNINWNWNRKSVRMQRKKKNQNSKKNDESQKKNQVNDVTKKKCIAIEKEVSNVEFFAIELTCNVM